MGPSVSSVISTPVSGSGVGVGVGVGVVSIPIPAALVVPLIAPPNKPPAMPASLYSASASSLSKGRPAWARSSIC